MAEGVERFRHIPDLHDEPHAKLVPDPNSLWVRYSDYEKLERDRDEWRNKKIVALDRIKVLEAQRDQARQEVREELRGRLEKAWTLLDRIADPLNGQPSRMHPDQTTDAELATDARKELRELLTIDPSGEQGED